MRRRALVGARRGRARTLERDQQRHRLYRVVATVDIVAHEQVVGVWARAADPKDLDEIVELRMDVAADNDWRAHLLYVGLLVQHLARLRQAGQ